MIGRRRESLLAVILLVINDHQDVEQYSGQGKSSCILHLTNLNPLENKIC
jgi:hypothetical protein